MVSKHEHGIEMGLKLNSLFTISLNVQKVKSLPIVPRMGKSVHRGQGDTTLKDGDGSESPLMGFNREETSLQKEKVY